MATNEAWDKVAEDEANALAALLESDTRKVIVFVIAHDRLSEPNTILIAQGVSKKTLGKDLFAFIQGAERVLKRLKAKAYAPRLG